MINKDKIIDKLTEEALYFQRVAATASSKEIRSYYTILEDAYEAVIGEIALMK